jgi:hypothetical protein
MCEILVMSVDLSDEIRQRCEGWVHRFCEFVAGNPFHISCDVSEVPAALRGCIEANFDKEDMGSFTAAFFDEVIKDIPWDRVGDGERVNIPKLVILCDPSHQLVTTIRKANPGALWGASNGSVSVVYEHEPAVVWHEMFHLFGAEDCYEGDSAQDSTTPKCGHINCLMQYAPTLARVGDPPFLCEHNRDLIRSFARPQLPPDGSA